MRKYYLSGDRDLIDEERAMEKPGSKAYHGRKSYAPSLSHPQSWV